jgi:deoxyhypusine synthase
MNDKKSKYLAGPRISPEPIGPGLTVDRLIETTFFAYNAGKLGKACRLFTEKMLADDSTVGLSVAGAMTPAGLGVSTLSPLLKAGFVDWVISTGANLYHDAHFGLGLALHQGSHDMDDTLLLEEGVIRIYDVVFPYDVLLSTDAFLRRILEEPAFQKPMGTAELHYLIGGYLVEREEKLGLTDTCLLTVAHRCGVPLFVSSPGDSSIGMNVAELWLRDRGPTIDVSRDVNETAAIVYDAKRSGGTSAVVILGGGSPKNFLLQTEPQIQEVLGLDEAGHDYFLQFTDARPDTGGLSGATPAEAVSWGKVDPEKLPDSVVAYIDSTVAAPLLTAWAMSRHAPRPLKRLYDRREALIARLRDDYNARREGKVKAGKRAPR